MISCILRIEENIEDLHSIFLSENLSGRARCSMEKDDALVFRIEADDPVGMKAFLNSILKTIQIYNVTRNKREDKRTAES